MAQLQSRLSLKLRAIVIALVVFTILHVLLLLAARTFAKSPEDAAAVMPMLNVAAYPVYLVTGLVAGINGRNAPILHGVVAGFLASIIAIVLFGSTEGDPVGVAILIANGVIFGGLGGTCSLLFVREARKDN